MNEVNHSPICERADDLVSVLYGEASEPERRDFELHLQQCGNCRAEFAGFAQVRESIGEWRDEALTGFVPAHATPAPVRKSALAAVRQFFDLSPLWLKGAVGLAAAIFCVLAALALMRSPAAETVPQITAASPDAVYTKQELDRAVQDALANQEREQRLVVPKPVIVADTPTPKRPNVAKSERAARRPFSKAEREQLAAELRLLSSEEEIDLDLLNDRRNR